MDILGGGRQNIRRQMENDSSLIFSPLSHEIYDENQKVGEVFFTLSIEEIKLVFHLIRFNFQQLGFVVDQK